MSKPIRIIVLTFVAFSKKLDFNWNICNVSISFSQN